MRIKLILAVVFGCLLGVGAMTALVPSEASTKVSQTSCRWSYTFSVGSYFWDRGTASIEGKSLVDCLAKLGKAGYRATTVLSPTIGDAIEGPFAYGIVIGTR